MSAILSSDFLEAQYGSLQFEVLQQDKAGRIIRNTAIETGKIVELSRVTFRPEGIKMFPETHHKILTGESIGTSLREAGLQPNRHVHASSSYDQRTLPRIFARQFESHEAPLVTHLTMVVEPDGVPYADILEVYRPETEPWEAIGGDMGQEIADQLGVFGAELAALDDSA